MGKRRALPAILPWIGIGNRPYGLSRELSINIKGIVPKPELKFILSALFSSGASSLWHFYDFMGQQVLYIF